MSDLGAVDPPCFNLIHYVLQSWEKSINGYINFTDNSVITFKCETIEPMYSNIFYLSEAV